MAEGEGGALDTVQMIASAISAFAAVAATVAAIWAINQSRQIHHETTSPDVAVYLERNQRWWRALDLVIRNIGPAPAYFVQFRVQSEDGLPFGFFSSESVYLLQHGIRYLAPGQEFRFTVDEYLKIQDQQTTLAVSYYARHEISSGEPRTEHFTLIPHEHSAYTEFQNREREAHIAIKDTLDALRYGRITVNVRSEDEG